LLHTYLVFISAKVVLEKLLRQSLGGLSCFHSCVGHQEVMSFAALSHGFQRYFRHLLAIVLEEDFFFQILPDFFWREVAGKLTVSPPKKTNSKIP
jgi:hypothetical protein